MSSECSGLSYVICHIIVIVVIQGPGSGRKATARPTHVGPWAEGGPGGGEAPPGYSPPQAAIFFRKYVYGAHFTLFPRFDLGKTYVAWRNEGPRPRPGPPGTSPGPGLIQVGSAVLRFCGSLAGPCVLCAGVRLRR